MIWGCCGLGGAWVAPALLFQQLLQLLRIGGRGVALGPLLLEHLDGLGSRPGTCQRDALSFKKRFDLFGARRPIVDVKFGRLEHAQRLDILDFRHDRLNGCG